MIYLLPMEQFNKALSFILGLVVVAVFIIVASGKINIKGINLAKSTKTPTPAISITPKPTSKPWFSFGAKPTVQPTSRPVQRPLPTQTMYTYNKTGATQQIVDPNYHSYSGSSVPTSIPNTGVPFLLFPLLGTSLITGVFLKKTEVRSKK